MVENKRFNVFDVDGTVFFEDHKEGSYHIGQLENVDINCLGDIADKLNAYVDENGQLKKDCTTLIYHNQNYRKENEQLKQDAKQVLFVLSCVELNFKLSVNEVKAIKRLNDYVNGCFNTEKLGDVE